MRPKLLIWVAILASAGTMLAQNANNQLVQQLKNQPVARVNGNVLTQRELLREMYSIFPYARTHNGFPKSMESDIRAGALKMIEFEELVYQEALRRRMTIAPAKLDSAVADFRKQFSTADEYAAYLASEMSGSEDKLRASIRRSMLIEQILQTEVTSHAPVSPAEAKAYYDKNPDRFRLPESFAFQTISILPPAKATAAQLKDAAKRANDALRQAKNTKTYNDFGLLAEKISDDDFRVNMGDHHSVDRAKIPSMVVETILAMTPGQISGLIQLDQAYCIVRLNSHTQAGMKSFEEVKDSLRKELEKDKTERLRVSLDKKLRAAGKIEEL
jgi:peptidyl-prolyl cis-trans isomerase C